MNIIDQIIAFENGELDNDQIIALFSKLIKNGMAWTLQGMYGRMAVSLINDGYLDKNGKIL